MSLDEPLIARRFLLESETASTLKIRAVPKLVQANPKLLYGKHLSFYASAVPTCVVQKGTQI